MCVLLASPRTSKHHVRVLLRANNLNRHKRTARLLAVIDNTDRTALSAGFVCVEVDCQFALISIIHPFMRLCYSVWKIRFVYVPVQPLFTEVTFTLMTVGKTVAIDSQTLATKMASGSLVPVQPPAEK